MPKFIHPAELDSALSLSKHNSALEANPDIATINQAIGAYNDQKASMMQTMYPPVPVVENVEDDDKDEESSEPMSPESQAMYDRNVEAAEELEMSPSMPGDDFSKFQRGNVDPNMNGYKIVFMRNRPHKIHEYSEEYITKRNPITKFMSFDSCEARVRALLLDPIRFECCEKMNVPKACEIVLIDKP